MKIAIIGTGYVGLVTGTCLAEAGNHVIAVDIDAAKIATLKQKQTPIYEPKLSELLERNVDASRLGFTTDLKAGIKEAQIVFLALPTPPAKDGSADLSYILGVADQLGKTLDHYTVIVNKSTVPVGAAEKVRAKVGAHARVKFDVVSNPEFLREGFAVDDFMRPDRIVIGCSSNKARALMEELYASYVQQGSPLLLMDERSAEMTKYAANAFLATKISFMNEIANLSELTGVNVDDVRLGIGADERIGKRFLFPGIGYGGSCFPKDVQALHMTAAQNGYKFRILESVTTVNKLQKKVLVAKLNKHFKNRLKGKTISLWGLAFKPDTDDIREASSLAIIDGLLAAGAKIKAYDPEAGANVRRLYQKEASLEVLDDQYDVLKDSDALLIVTEWPVFKSPDFKLVKSLLKSPLIFDGRNLYSLEEMAAHGFHYESIGRRIV